MISVAQAVAPYRSERLPTRAHVAIRWLSCPFGAVIDAMPPAGDVLDYGCGHGALSFALATGSTRSVTGVDIDAGKIDVARRVAAATGSQATFSTVRAGEIPDGAWDGIAVVDVLYLLPPDAQRATIVGLASRLRPGGRLVVKEMDESPPAKAAWMRLQERIAVRAARITQGSTLAFTHVPSLERAMAEAGLRVARRRVDRRYPHPHVLLVGTRA